MSLYRGRLYSVEDVQKLMFLKRYKEEQKLYDIEVIENSSFPKNYIEDNLITTANVILLLAIERFSDDFISVSDLNLIYDKILTFTKNRDILGDMKVFHKLMKIAEELHYRPFVATT